MIFPQYLWRIRCRDKWLLIRRGNTFEEAMEKYHRKDEKNIIRIAMDRDLNLLPVGIGDVCDIEDNKLYNTNHPWDWFNE